MKITIATGIYPPETGGPATFLKDFVPLLKKNGWKVDVITYGAPREGVIAIARENPVRWYSFYRAVLKSARDSDIIFTTDTFSSGLPAARAAKKLEKRLIVRFVGDSAWENSRNFDWTDDPFEVFQKKKYGWNVELFRKFQRFVLSRAEIITVSGYLQALLRKWGFKSTVIPNAVSAVKLPVKNVLRKKLGFDKKFVLLNVGRITKYKGVDKIVRLCAKLRKEIPELLLVVVGEGPALNDAKKVAEQELITHIVQFVGKKDAVETRTLMKASDVLVLNSEYEGMSHTLLEAMSVDCPVVASDVCGNPELVKNRGILFEYNNMDELKDAVLKLFKDPVFARKLAEKALKQLPMRGDVDKKLLSYITSGGK